MKNITFLFLLVFAARGSFSQGHFPIPADSSAQWRVTLQMWEPSPWWMVTDDRMYFFEGDTVISGRTYQKLYASGSSYVASPPDGTTYLYSHEYRGGIRNEGHKVYYTGWGQDTLLYDFSLQAGDHLPVTWINDTGIVVTSVDSVLIGSGYRKRFNIAGPANGTLLSHWIIEGMGHEYGLVELMYGVPDNNSSFQCYAEHSTPLFPPGVQCDLSLKDNEKLTQATPVSVFPNPSSGNFTVSCPDVRVTPLHYTVLTPAGQQVAAGNWALTGGKNEIGLDLHGNGFYFLMIEPGIHAPARYIKLIIQR